MKVQELRDKITEANNMYPADALRDFLLDNKDKMTLDLIARVIKGVYDDFEVKLLVERLEATNALAYNPKE